MKKPETWRPRSVDEFLGKAGRVVKKLIRKFERHGEEDLMPPIKLMFTGTPGTGKSEVAKFLARQLSGDPLNFEVINGTRFNLDKSQTFANTFGMGSLLGGPGAYRGLVVDEIDKCTKAAQIDCLTMIDKLPDGMFLIVTTNEPVDKFEPRFYSRFQRIGFDPVDNDEITDLLTREFGIAEDSAMMIGVGACGNVRLALLDAQSHLDFSDEPEAVAA